MPENTYTPVDPTVFMARYDQSQARRVGGQRGWKLQQGPPGRPIRSVIRMMPGHSSMGGDPIVETKVHFNLGPQQNTATPCLEPYGKNCPACQWSEELYARSRRAADPNAGKEYKDLAGRVRAKMRFVCHLVDMAHPENGVQEFFFNDELEKKLRACFLDDQTPPQFRDITHPTTGRDIVLEVGTKPNTEWASYDVVRAKDTASPLPDPKWLTQINDLVAEHVYEPTVEQVQGALQGQRIVRAPRALPAGQAPTALPAAVTPAPTTAPTPAAAPAPAPLPAAASAPAPGRGRSTAGTKAAVVPEILPPAAAPAATPAPAPTPVASRRQPVAAAANGSFAAAYAWARGEILTVFPNPREITEQELSVTGKPPCYMEETEPSDTACQQCSVLIPCFAIKMGKLART